jgi:hypothetical protein
MLRQSVLALPLVSLPLVLCGCNTGGVIQSVALAPGQTPTLGQPVDVIISGSGVCTILQVNWGDDGNIFTDYNNLDLGAGAHITHTYTGWPGGRTVTVKAQYQCDGSARMRFIALSATNSLPTASLVWRREPTGNRGTCGELPGMPQLNKNSLVHITSPPSPPPPAPQIVVNFGCPFDGCIYDVDGRAGSSAASPFLFPGFREYSLVLRMGSDGPQFQGGKSATPFSVPDGGTLNFCMNTDRPDANITGGWEVDIQVDELGFN